MTGCSGVDEVRANQIGIDRKGAQRARLQRRADAVGFNRLNLVFGLAGADEDTEAALTTVFAVSDQVARRAAGSCSSSGQQRRRIRIDQSGVDVELDDPVVALAQRRVVVVPQAVVQREVRRTCHSSCANTTK